MATDENIIYKQSRRKAKRDRKVKIARGTSKKDLIREGLGGKKETIRRGAKN